MKKLIHLVVIILAFPLISFTQITNQEISQQISTFTPAVPFLLLPAEAESAAIAQINSVGAPGSMAGIFGNAGMLMSKYSRWGTSFSYMPWVRALIPDMNYFSAGGYYRLNQKHLIGANFTLFTLGHIQVIKDSVTYNNNPYETAPSVFYAYRINRHHTLSARLKYIHSDLVGGMQQPGVNAHVGRSVAIDLGYTGNISSCDGTVQQQVGLLIQNIGSKISYTQNSDKEFIPTNLKAGYRFALHFSNHANVFVAYEIEKLMIPSNPVYFSDSVDQNGDPVIMAGMDPDVTVALGMIRSFYDSPFGFEGEMHEIIHHFAIGATWRFLTLTGGYYSQPAQIGNNKFYTLGTFVRLRGLRLGGSYILPVVKNSHLKNTFQLSLAYMAGA